MTYTNALRHTITGKWYMMICDNTGEYGWTDVLWLADVYDDPADMAQVIKPYNSEWVALTWAQYSELMDDRPTSLHGWLDAIDAARA